MAFGLYLHIPYCLAKCRYCDCYSKGGRRGVPDAYVEALARAMAAYMAGRGQPPLRPDTLYFGGGTPSLLTPAQVRRLVDAACPLPGAEVTLEANPETVTLETLAGYRNAGVNRVSFGVQTARPDSLARLGRPHTAAQSRQALAWARQAGFENISGDIMLALPHYSNSEFDETLALLAGSGAVHISAYLLKVEPGTAFGRRPPQGLPSEDEAADFYLYAVDRLQQAGYAQYEISNFARPGYEGQHNLIYWNCQDYLGLGPAAHSCMDRRRFYWPGDTDAFIAGQASPLQDGACGAEDFIMLQLRLSKGLDLSALRRDYGAELTPRQFGFIEKCVQAGYAAFDGKVLRLTPAGLIIQNSILAGLLG